MHEPASKATPRVTLRINRHAVTVPVGTSVAAALAMTDRFVSRADLSGRPRGPLCGMGVCFECRATIDGVPEVLMCLTPCREDQEVVTDA
ncbi:(2Fe-2S)-binding protein [Myxococcus xanthus]|uniref:(2Fe-2S)-binding protein n=1 Tax=Myxococcus xanthus TaxID=34 RepID=A0A7Y4IGT6_MYXXA|nr:(2Fe-2S)-binding protein [Myxococcus xanthus]NOJ79013.1 (2Fe-2S)-binding protein [Myxococcus xanthus]NOJ85966.1 (2Fe-2S)-binding protein [Myxococcus xanthus]